MLGRLRSGSPSELFLTCKSTTSFMAAQVSVASRLFFGLAFCRELACEWRLGPQLLPGALCLPGSLPARGS